LNIADDGLKRWYSMRKSATHLFDLLCIDIYATDAFSLFDVDSIEPVAARASQNSGGPWGILT